MQLSSWRPMICARPAGKYVSKLGKRNMYAILWNHVCCNTKSKQNDKIVQQTFVSGHSPCRPLWFWLPVWQPVRTGWPPSLQSQWRTCYHGWFPQLLVVLVSDWRTGGGVINTTLQSTTQVHMEVPEKFFYWLRLYPKTFKNVWWSDCPTLKSSWRKLP